MGLFTKNRAPSPKNGDVNQSIASLGLNREQFDAKVNATPALTQVIALAEAVDAIGAYLTSGYLVNGPTTPEGQASLAQAGLLLIAARTVADDLLQSVTLSLKSQGV